MHGKPGLAAKALGLIVAGVLAGSAVAKEKPEDTSLKEKLEAQYKAAKLSGVSLDTAEGGTVLSIEKPGILGSSRFLGIPNRYRGGVLHAPDKISLALNDASIERVGQEPIDKRPLPVGDKVYVLRIYVSVKREKITFDTVECNACNGVTQGSPYESTVEFEFPKGYLETASVSQVEDTISQVFGIDSGGEAQQAQTGQVRQSPEQGQATAGPALTNGDIIRMVQAKLGDSLIIAKIKSSASGFDTSTDGLVKLKQADVSDAVLQAMVETPASAAPPVPPAAVEAPKPTGNPLVDVFNTMTYPLRLGGEMAQKQWEGLKGQPLELGGIVDSVEKSSEPGTYLVRIDVLDSSKAAPGVYDIELKDSKQPNVKNLAAGDAVRFKGVIDSYTATPNVMLTVVGEVIE